MSTQTPLPDAAAPAAAAAAATVPPRAVVFMTAPSAEDVPALDALRPACLLPFGSQTFAERVLDSCARAGLREVDLVVSDQPELLRALLNDGFRWGLRLNWHVVKDAETPYGLLHTLGLQAGQRVLIGHGHRWVAPDVVRALADGDAVAVRVGPAVGWTGWVSLDALFLNAISPHADADALAEVAVSLQSRHCVMVERREFAWAGPALELLQAQELALHDESGLHVPATWLRFPWGAMSPDAEVHPQAEMEGPVLVGPRCLVERGARVGPDAVLSRDVLVSGGAVVRDALVLPNTFVSGSVTLDHVVAQGNQIQDLRWSARATLPASDGLLAPLAPREPARPGWGARLLAALLALLLLPMWLLLALVRTLRGHMRPWQGVQAVRGRCADTGALQHVTVRVATGAGLPAWLSGRFGALLDVAQGRRQWFGIRPRDEAQWYALRRDWQLLFADQPVGFFHAPSWIEVGERADGEALAAADAYFTVRASFGERLRTLRLLARTFRVADARL
jgi:NDP-sugar pyrophosphorylase family protein